MAVATSACGRGHLCSARSMPVARALLLGLLCCMMLAAANAAKKSPAPSSSPKKGAGVAPSPKAKTPKTTSKPSKPGKNTGSPSPSRASVPETALSLAIPATGSYVVGCNYGGSGKCLSQPAAYRLPTGATASSVPLLEGLNFRVTSPVRIARADFKLVLSAPWNATLYTTPATNIQFTAWLFSSSDGSREFIATNAVLLASSAPSSANLATNSISTSKDQPNTKLSISFDDTDPKLVLKPGGYYYIGISSADTVFCSVALPAASVPATATGCSYPTSDYCKAPMADCTYSWRIYNNAWGRSDKVIPHIDVYGSPA